MFWSVNTEHGIRDVHEEDRCGQERSNTGGRGNNIRRLKWQMKQHFLMRTVTRRAHVGAKSRNRPASRNLFAKYCASMWSCRDAQKCLQNLSGAKNGASRIGWREESERADADGLGCRVYNPQTWEREGHFGERKLATYTVNKILRKIAMYRLSIGKLTSSVSVTHPNERDGTLFGKYISQPLTPVERVILPDRCY